MTTRIVLATMFLALAGAAGAQTPQTNLGTLTCTLAETAEQPANKQASPVGEERAMRCAFKPTESGVEQTYSGIIRKVGPGDIAGGKQVMIWVVQGPVDAKMDPGMLEQTYVGAPDLAQKSSSGAVLVGERNKKIVMRAETQTQTSDDRTTVTVMELKILTVPA